MIELKQTRHQVPRGTRADAEKFNVLYLIKNASRLNLTYQIKLLTFQAHAQHKKLVLMVPSHCQFSDELNSFVSHNKKLVSVERKLWVCIFASLMEMKSLMASKSGLMPILETYEIMS